MEDMKRDSGRVFRSTLDSSGRIVLPREVRELMHVSPGDDVQLVEQDGALRLETPEQALREAQDYFTSLVPPGVSVVDELVEERRAEAARE